MKIRMRGNENTVAGRDAVQTGENSRVFVGFSNGSVAAMDQSTVIVNPTIKNVHRRATSAEGLSPAQQRAISTVIKQLVQREMAGDASGADAQRFYAKWYGALKRRFDVDSRLDIPRERGDEVIAWLKQQRAIKRSKLRRNDPLEWRKDLYNRLWPAAEKAGLSKGDVYALAAEKLGTRVVSLTQLSQQNLDKLAGIIYRMQPKEASP